jgi:hypothetical protein
MSCVKESRLKSAIAGSVNRPRPQKATNFFGRKCKWIDNFLGNEVFLGVSPRFYAAKQTKQQEKKKQNDSAYFYFLQLRFLGLALRPLRENAPPHKTLNSRLV